MDAKYPTGGLLLRAKQDEKRIASPANVPETSTVASPSVLPLPQLILRPSPSSLSEFSGISLVVDLGCGTGGLSEMLAAELGARVIGLDPSEKMIDQARRKPATSPVVAQAARKLS